VDAGRGRESANRPRAAANRAAAAERSQVPILRAASQQSATERIVPQDDARAQATDRRELDSDVAGQQLVDYANHVLGLRLDHWQALGILQWCNE
jgi:hypothetical protein